MRIDYPESWQTASLLALWKSVFGEHDGFWELFLDTAFLADHCRCITIGGQVAAALYWFDCSCSGQKLAYLYAVVTHPDYRNRGLCRTLMEDTHELLNSCGYAGVLLVPEKEPLRGMYQKLGYRDCTAVSEFACTAGAVPVPLRSVDAEAYAALRRQLLPENGVLQEDENLAFLTAQAQLYAGEDILLAAWQEEDKLHGMELLGSAEAAPGILRSLGFARGTFRCPGTQKPFAMFRPLKEQASTPAYFGLAFD